PSSSGGHAASSRQWYGPCDSSTTACPSDRAATKEKLERRERGREDVWRERGPAAGARGDCGGRAAAEHRAKPGLGGTETLCAIAFERATGAARDGASATGSRSGRTRSVSVAPPDSTSGIPAGSFAAAAVGRARRLGELGRDEALIERDTSSTNSTCASFLTR